MSDDNSRFPINEARDFAKRKGLGTAVDYIEHLKELPGWSSDRVREVKKGKYIQLFDGYGLFVEFKKTYWPRADKPDNPFTKRLYIEKALAYDDALQRLADH